jgi:Amt family ammonium transporter
MTNVTEILLKIQHLQNNVIQQQVDFEGFFYYTAATFIFMMQLGFALLEAGTVRSKNVKSVLLKNLLDLCVASTCWYFIGNAISGGGFDTSSLTSLKAEYQQSSVITDHTTNKVAPQFANTNNDSYNPEKTKIVQSVYAMGFLATATTIVSGAVLARMNLYAYLISSVVMSIFTLLVPFGCGMHRVGCTSLVRSIMLVVQ